MEPFISIIIPAYNVTAYISDCLESVLSQDVDYNSYEIIVVDDCSPYEEQKIIDSYIKRHKNVRYIRHEINKRQGGARNTGIRAANGKYVMFLDADDFLVYRNTLSVLLEAINKYEPLVLRSEWYEIYSSDDCFESSRMPLMEKEPRHSIKNFTSWRLGNMSCSVCSTLYSRVFLLNNKLFFRENVLYEDTDWTQKVMFYAKSIDFLDFAFYGYRQTLGSTTRGHSIDSFRGAIEGVIEEKKWYDSLDVTIDFRNYINEIITDNAIGFLKFSRDYPITVSIANIKRLNRSGLTLIKSKRMCKNIILFLMRYVPLLCVCIIKLMIYVKRFAKKLIP